jgi:hypothetical protein
MNDENEWESMKRVVHPVDELKNQWKIKKKEVHPVDERPKSIETYKKGRSSIL